MGMVILKTSPFHHNEQLRVERIKGTILSLLRRCDLPFKVKPLDQDFYQQCVADAVRRGYTMDGHLSMQTYLREGVVYASNCAAHLGNKQTQIWVAHFASCAFVIDDIVCGSTADLANAYQFNNRFNRGQEQGNRTLAAAVDLLHRMPDHFQALVANLITTSFLSFINGTLLEIETEGMNVSSAAYEYPTYSRTLSGLSEAMVILSFPREVPIKDYIQAVPEALSFFNGVNDILSFYKEEKAGETTNRVSLLAARDNMSKLDVLDALVESTVMNHSRALKILEGSPVAYEAYKHFSAGLVTSFGSIARYKLADLELEVSVSGE